MKKTRRLPLSLERESGFTMIEMMLVLLVISVLILIAIPNVAKHSKSIDEKGCNAYVKMVEGQVEAYKIQHHKTPTMADLESEQYLPKDSKCPNGKTVHIDAESGAVSVAS